MFDRNPVEFNLEQKLMELSSGALCDDLSGSNYFAYPRDLPLVTKAIIRGLCKIGNIEASCLIQEFKALFWRLRNTGSPKGAYSRALGAYEKGRTNDLPKIWAMAMAQLDDLGAMSVKGYGAISAVRLWKVTLFFAHTPAINSKKQPELRIIPSPSAPPHYVIKQKTPSE